MKSYFILQKGLLFGLALILCAGQVGETQAERANAPDHLLVSIQDAIINAKDGDIVTIDPGTYYETLIVDKNITLVGSGSTTPILQPSASKQRVITVTDGYNLILENLIITGGQAPQGSNGGGVYVANGSLTLTSCWITNNSADNGGGIFQGGTGGKVTVNGSTIDGNTATFQGGGLYSGGNVEIYRSTLSDNTAGTIGGGINVIQGSLYIKHGIITNNHATTGSGGGVNVNNGFNILATQFSNNSAGVSGGGLAQLNAGQSLSITGTSFYKNTAKSQGGGAYINSFLTLSNSSFTSNIVDFGATGGDVYGGGLYTTDGLNGSGLTITTNQVNCTGCYNKSGGGLYVTKSSSITLSTFDGNSAWTGGGIFSPLDGTVTLTLTHSSFKNHVSGCWLPDITCGAGSGVFALIVDGDQLLFENNLVDSVGGGIFAHQVTLTDSRFIGNEAGLGGGVFAQQSLIGDNLFFAKNVSIFGAALNVPGSAELRHATIAQPSHSDDTAIKALSGPLTVTNSIISGYGTGIYIDGIPIENNNLFWNNDFNIYTPGEPLSLVDASLIDADPLFVNPAAGDYHLRAGSPAIGGGTNLGITTDLDGRSRINRWDIGAYQFWMSLFLPAIVK